MLHPKNLGHVISFALAWLLAQGDDIIPIPRTKRQKYIEQNIKAVDVELSEENLKTIIDIVSEYPNTGERYDIDSLKLTNS